MTARVFISGFVQGVGFRQFIQRSAQELRLTGWVKNLPASQPASTQRGEQGGPDNRVEAVFSGSKEQIEKIITICRKGPFLADIKSVDVIWEKDNKEEAYENFEIR